MAEIEFQRRGTPLWLVLLILAIVGGIGYFVFAGRDAAPSAATQTASQTATAAPAPKAGTPAAESAAAVAPVSTGPAVEFANFVQQRRFPRSGAADQRAYMSEVLRHMSAGLQQRVPSAGIQVVLLKALADTIAMPETKASRIPDMTQLAFFAYSRATQDLAPGSKILETQAAALDPLKPLGEQVTVVQTYLDAASKLARDPNSVKLPDPGLPRVPKPGPTATPPAGGASKGAAGSAPAAAPAPAARP